MTVYDPNSCYTEVSYMVNRNIGKDMCTIKDVCPLKDMCTVGFLSFKILETLLYL